MHIGLFGLGVVGSAVYEILQHNAAIIRSQTRVDVVVRRVCVRDPDKARTVALPAGLLTTDPRAILDDPEIEVVVEVMGGLSPAREYMLQALQRGKSVITANKEVIADHGPELFEMAENAGADLLFEASVGGGIPILRPLAETLAAGRIRRVLGIINGTTNYILSQMSQTGAAFATALAEAKARGYAEADPTADVEGHDAARKLAILAAIAFHAKVNTAFVRTEGITRIGPADIAYGRERGWVVKLIALAQARAGEIEARVQPCFLPAAHPLAGVSDAFNAIYIYGDEVGETMFYGRGAGGLPTASAVIGDIVAAVRNRRVGVSFSENRFHRPLRPISPEAVSARYCLRLALDPLALPARRRRSLGAAAPWPESGLAEHLPGEGSAGVEQACAACGVPVHRLTLVPGSGDKELVLETGRSNEANVAHLKDLLQDVPGVRTIMGTIRILTDAD